MVFWLVVVGAASVKVVLVVKSVVIIVNMIAIVIIMVVKGACAVVVVVVAVVGRLNKRTYLLRPPLNISPKPFPPKNRYRKVIKHPPPSFPLQPPLQKRITIPKPRTQVRLLPTPFFPIRRIPPPNLKPLHNPAKPIHEHLVAKPSLPPFLTFRVLRIEVVILW